LRALGAPPGAKSDASAWPSLSHRTVSEWQARGISASRAGQFAAFFGCAEVRMQADRLHLAGVQGF
jgi:DNA ligase (NAD+)